MFFFFFFQAEDGIRDLTVTGVQTCALPISPDSTSKVSSLPRRLLSTNILPQFGLPPVSLRIWPKVGTSPSSTCDAYAPSSPTSSRITQRSEFNRLIQTTSARSPRYRCRFRLRQLCRPSSTQSRTHGL